MRSFNSYLVSLERLFRLIRELIVPLGFSPHSEATHSGRFSVDVCVNLPNPADAEKSQDHSSHLGAESREKSVQKNGVERGVDKLTERQHV